jgi:hypothetical protein
VPGRLVGASEDVHVAGGAVNESQEVQGSPTEHDDTGGRPSRARAIADGSEHCLYHSTVSDGATL